MTRSILTRRSGAVLTSVAVAAALTILAPSAAQAGVHAQFAAAGQASANYTGPTVGGQCNLASGDSSVESSIATFSHGTKSRSASVDATFASTDNAADTVRVQGHVNTSLNVKRRGKDLASFNLGVGGTVKVSHALTNSNCAGSGAVLGEMAFQFTEHHKGWFYLTRDTKKPGSISEFVLINLNSGKLVTLDLFEGTKSHSVSRALLKPGNYGIELAEAGIMGGGSGGIALKSQARVSKIARSITLLGEFKPKH
jgi:hypothetical protein